MQFQIGGGNRRGFVVHFRGVLVDGGRGLGAEVAPLRVKIERADAVFTVRAGEPYAAPDALDPVGFHTLNSSPPRGGHGARQCGGDGNGAGEKKSRTPDP